MYFLFFKKVLLCPNQMTHDTQHFHTWETLTHYSPCFEMIKELITR